eukprot:8066771-Karenia_brevis.AAC.1
MSYTWRRHVTYNGMTHVGVKPNRGIVAGCASATTELKTYMYSVLSGVIYRHPEVNVEAYIDDLTIEAHTKNLDCL